MRTTVYSSLLISSILVLNMISTASAMFTVQGNLVENGDFSQGFEHWEVGSPTNPCERNNPSGPGGYYGCAMVTDEGTPGNPHLEVWVGTGGEYGMERFEQGVSQRLSRLPNDSSRVTLSLRVWSLGSHGAVHLVMDSGSGGNLTVEEMYAAQGDYYELFLAASPQPITITRDIPNFHAPTTYLFVGGDRVAIDDITILAVPLSPEPVFKQQVDLIRNGDFSQGSEDWKYWDSWNFSSCCMQISEKASPGNPYAVLDGGFDSDIFQVIHLPQDATGISLSLKAWALTLPGQNPENIWPWVMVGITFGGGAFNGTGEQERYSFGKTALRLEPVSAMTRDLTGFKGRNITLTLMGGEAAVDDVSVLATRSYFGVLGTVSGLFMVAAIILATVVGGFLWLRHVRKARNHQNRLRPIQSYATYRLLPQPA